MGYDMQRLVTENYRGLKTAVIVMGVLLVVGTIALIIGMVQKSGEIDEVFAKSGAPRNIALAPELAGRVVQMTQDGNRLSLLIERDGIQRVVVIDIASGALLATVQPGAAWLP